MPIPKKMSKPGIPIFVVIFVENVAKMIKPAQINSTAHLRLPVDFTTFRNKMPRLCGSSSGMQSRNKTRFDRMLLSRVVIAA